MTTPSDKFGFAVVRSESSIRAPFVILCVFHSMKEAHEYIEKFANDFTNITKLPPGDLRDLNATVPEWWKAYHLFAFGAAVGEIYIERVKLEGICAE